ncbi:rRNA-processing protein sof1 [Dinochytrium kinnereticum]|nr:rRNA-processing protein sof1 [Dinochytrium kinnereticum]
MPELSRRLMAALPPLAAHQKVKAISRSKDDHVRGSAGDIHKLHRNLDPTLHPFERAREYTRALNAVKLERLFAKPFIAALSGHRDGVYCLAKHPTNLTSMLSGSADGEIRLWSLQTQKTVWSAIGHQGFVRGICAVPNSNTFITAGEDKVVKFWNDTTEDATASYVAKYALTGLDHHRWENKFATSSTKVDIWDHDRSEPICSLSWGAETITTVKFNQTETSILASAGTDRTITLYDIRTNQPIQKAILALRTNAIAWNPMEAFNFTAANEDHNLYMFDMRKMDRSLNVLKDHVSAVMDVDYSPTGQEVLSGSYDQTVRIYRARDGHSRDVYHTKRMQKVFCVKFTMDNKFVLSGSDDGSVRIWKAEASAKIGALNPREQNALDYSKSLKERYKHMPEIKRIDKQRHIPKNIISVSKKKRVMIDSRKKKEDNERKHSAPGQVPYTAERKKNILKIEKPTMGREEVLDWFQRRLNRPPEAYDMYKVAKDFYQLGAYSRSLLCLQLYITMPGATLPGRHLLGYCYLNLGEPGEDLLSIVAGGDGALTDFWSPERALREFKKCVKEGYHDDWQLVVELTIEIASQDKREVV